MSQRARAIPSSEKSNYLVYSRRNEDGVIEIAILFENLLIRLLGDQPRLVHGPKPEKSWRRILKSITIAIEKTLDRTLVTDAFHRNEIARYLTHLREAGKKSPVPNISVIYALLGILFEVLGGLPRYGDQKSCIRGDCYSLDHLRTICYAQSASQKINTILEAARSMRGVEFYEELVNKLRWECGHDTKRFLNLIKKRYRKFYTDVF